MKPREMSTPPAGEVEWTFRTRLDDRGRRRWAKVRARSWFAARDLAAAELGVGRDEVEVVR